MPGQEDQALETLELAASLGWRGYFFVLNDLRWQQTLQQPEFRSILSGLKAAIDRQRERVEAIDAKEDFRAYVEARGASGQR